MNDDLEEFQEDERGVGRRSVLAMFGLTGLATMGSALWLSQSFYRDDDDPDVIVYRDGETYDGDPDGVTYRPDESIGSWNEALPGSCSLSNDEKNWLVSRVDSYDNLDGEDFFEYVGREVRLEDSGDELRMTVDSDYSGDFDAETEYVVENGYNIPDAC